MALDVRGRYIVSFLVSVLITLLTADIYLRYHLEEWLRSQVLTGLMRCAHAGRALVESREQTLTAENLEWLARQFSQTLDVYITFIGTDGQAWGGTGPDEPAPQRRAADSPPEEMLQVEVPFRHPQGGSGLVRVAVALETVQAIGHRLRWATFLAGLIAMMTALSLSGFAAQWATRTQRHVIACARSMARSTHAPRIQIRSNDALAELASSLNLLAEEKEETSARLSEQQSKMAAVLQSMHEGVIALDGERCITLMNRSVQELFGLSHPALGQAVTLLLPVTAVQELGLDQAVLPTQPFAAEFDLDGSSPRRVMAVLTPLHEHPGHVIVLRDVTEKRRLERVRRDFVANVSHELRTPVSVLQANAQTLLGGALGDARYSRLLVDAMERNASRLARLIADLLDLSRLEADQVAMERHTLLLLPLVQEVVELVRMAANEKNIALQIVVSPTVAVLVDVEALRRILINFLDNAVKYIPEQSTVLVRVQSRSGRWRLEVVDNGPGIAPLHRDRLFERFYRVDSGRSRKMGGTGLGLAIVKHLAEKMGETVGMEAVEPQGSLFWVTLSQPTA